MLLEKIKILLEESLEDPIVMISDLKNDGRHLEVVIVSSTFETLTLLNRHRKVKEVLQELFKEGLHALSIKTYSVSEWKKRNI